jgi:tetratricopeptide (TPR) repeat protein
MLKNLAGPGILGFRMFATMVLVCGPAAGSFAQQTGPTSETSQIIEGVQALKSGDLDGAERIFNDALRHGVKHPLIFHNLGVIAQERGNQHLAVARFREALLLQPNYGPGRLLLGSSLLALGKQSEAIRELKRATLLMPNEPAAHLQLAKAHESVDNWLEAVDQLQQLVRLAPENDEYSYQLGKALTKLSGWSLQRISHINPESARLHQALGQEYLIQEKYDRALDAYRQAVSSDPEQPEIHLGMAVILLQLKRFDEALSEVELELELVPDSKAAIETKIKIEAAKAAAAP